MFSMFVVGKSLLLLYCSFHLSTFSVLQPHGHSPLPWNRSQNSHPSHSVIKEWEDGDYYVLICSRQEKYVIFIFGHFFVKLLRKLVVFLPVCGLFCGWGSWMELTLCKWMRRRWSEVIRNENGMDYDEQTIANREDWEISSFTRTTITVLVEASSWWLLLSSSPKSMPLSEPVGNYIIALHHHPRHEDVGI